MFDLYRSGADSRTPVRSVDLQDAHALVTGPSYAGIVARIRATAAKQRDAEAAAARRREGGPEQFELLATAKQARTRRDGLKTRSLAAFTFAGGFEGRRSKATLKSHSGLVTLDLDHVDDAPAVRDAVAALPSTALSFRSPSGDGVKVVVRVAPIPASAAEHVAAWQAAASAYADVSADSIDVSGKDCSRLCFVSHDPGAYLNPDAAALPWAMPAPMHSPKHNPAKAGHQPRGNGDDRGAITLLRKAFHDMRAAIEGERNVTLNTTGLLVAGLVLAGRATRADVDALCELAVERGLTASEVAATRASFESAASPLTRPATSRDCVPRIDVRRGPALGFVPKLEPVGDLEPVDTPHFDEPDDASTRHRRCTLRRPRRRPGRCP